MQWFFVTHFRHVCLGDQVAAQNGSMTPLIRPGIMTPRVNSLPSCFDPKSKGSGVLFLNVKYLI